MIGKLVSSFSGRLHESPVPASLLLNVFFSRFPDLVKILDFLPVVLVVSVLFCADVEGWDED